MSTRRRKTSRLECTRTDFPHVSISTMSHRNQMMNSEQEILDDNIEHTTGTVSSFAYEIRLARGRPTLQTISHHRRRLLNDEMLRSVSPQAQRLNYGRDGRILMLPRANKSRRTNRRREREELYSRRKKRKP